MITWRRPAKPMTKMRAAIYARFSSDLQNERSCRDQVDYCSAWAERQDITIVDHFTDEAVSGASAVNRFGLAKLLRAARERRFEVVLCEDLDRIARKQADLHRIRDELTFLGIRIMTVADGTITAMHAGLKGLMSEMYLADLAAKTRRGQSARVKAGGLGGGKSYGYDPVPGQSGVHTINEREAATVRRIFADYVDGKTPRQIVAELNAERIPSPRGGRWNSSTINGSRTRQNGILENRLYIGELVWNRQRFIKDPATGKRVSRLNPQSEWLISQVPAMAIVDADLFTAAQSRKAERTHDTQDRSSPVPAKPRHLLSGLLKCGCCGAGYTIIRRSRVGCAGYRERGDCTNNRTVARREIEERVLAAIEHHLADPEALAAYVQQYHQDRKDLAATQRKTRHTKARRVAELTRTINRIIDQICDGTATPILVERLREMEAEKIRLDGELAELDREDAPVALHPGAVEKYRRICSDLQAHLDTMRAGLPAERVLEEARKLIDKVTIHPPADAKKPVELIVHGLLSELLLPVGSVPLGRGALVAGAGFEPATFRL
jgi:site-specific DNA recombinase